MTTTVRYLTAADEAAWRRCWEAYGVFYETTFAEETTATTFARLIDEATPHYLGLIAERDGEVIGIANGIVHSSTWSPKDRCYLNDLYVDPAARGSGAGKMLIERLVEIGRERDWEQVHWLTAETNARARRLYDQFGPASGFINYRIVVK